MSENNANLVMSGQRNGAYLNTTALQVRLDTAPLIKEIQQQLQGYIVTFAHSPEGTIMENKIKIGTPLANDVGVQRIISHIRMLFNSHTAQGSITETRYEFFLERVHKSLATMILLNTDSWGIDRKERQHIMALIMNSLILFASRPIADGERKSLTESVQVHESSHTKETGSGFNILNFGKKNN